MSKGDDLSSCFDPTYIAKEHAETHTHTHTLIDTFTQKRMASTHTHIIGPFSHYNKIKRSLYKMEPVCGSGVEADVSVTR